MSITVTPLRRMALGFGMLMMPDDRAVSRRALMRLALIQWRYGRGGRMRGKRALRGYRGGQRAFIVFGTGAALYFANGGWWGIPLMAAALILAIW